MLPELTGVPATLTGSSISISDLLTYVNRYFPDVLPESVLRHFGHSERPAGKLGEGATAVSGAELCERLFQSTPPARGATKGEERRHELNIGAETLERPIENVVATMMHEAVHLYNLAHGVQDCSRGNTYHNKRFKEEAERRGLVIEHHPTYGWTITEPSEELIDYIIKQGWTEIRMNRGGDWTPPASTGGKAGNGGTDAGAAAPKRSSTRKYVCPCCKNSVRATKAVNLICGDCMEKMEVAE